jgi:hypothetical protein
MRVGKFPQEVVPGPSGYANAVLVSTWRAGRSTYASRSWGGWCAGRPERRPSGVVLSVSKRDASLRTYAAEPTSHRTHLAKPRMSLTSRI